MEAPTSVPPVYRAPLRSRDDAVDPAAAVAWALRRGVVAVGGRLDELPDGIEDAVDLVRQVHGDRVADRLARFAAVPSGPHVWTRSDDLGFRLGRIDGPWVPDRSEQARTLDLQHTRRCTWADVEIAPSEVPADVAATFARGGRNLQRTRSVAAEEATARVWARHSDPDAG